MSGSGTRIGLALLCLLPACGEREQRRPETELTQAGLALPANPEVATLRAATIAAIQREAPGNYAVESVAPGQLRAGNLQQGLALGFTAGGVEIAAVNKRWRLGLELLGVGREETLPRAARAVPVAARNRVSYRRSEGLTEWYVNGRLGLEQGFTLERRPDGGGPLTVAIALTGDLQGAQEGSVVTLRDGRDQVMLRYGELYARDARGALLPAGITLERGRILLRVSDEEATYPLEIDPLVWAQQELLVPGDPATMDTFGTAVAVSGTTALVGSPFDDCGGKLDCGSAYVFERSGIDWVFQQKLTAPMVSGPPTDPDANDLFGAAVALSGSTALIGAPGDDTAGGTDTGSAFVFVRSGSTWSFQAKLVASDGATGDNLGWSVALSGNTAVLGAPRDDCNAGPDCGSVYVFTRAGTTWSVSAGAPLVATDQQAGASFGHAVAAQGASFIAGVPLHDVGSSGSDHGAAYIFVYSGSNWLAQPILTATGAGSGDHFGHTVSLSGNTVAIGAPLADVPGQGADSGAAYLFVQDGTWSQEAGLAASDGTAGNRFGVAVSLSNDVVFVGAERGDSTVTNSGAVYPFVRDTAVWSALPKLTPSVPETDGGFGTAVSIEGDTAAIGAPLQDNSGGIDGGGAYIFRYLLELGDECVAGTECHSGFCVDGVCCNSACGGGVTTDCQACSIATGAAVDGTCSNNDNTYVCRPSAGGCDPEEICTGTSPTCPSDNRHPSGYVCGPAAGECDAVEVCNGTSPTCPADQILPATHVCREAAGECEADAYCSGSTVDCPVNAILPSSHVCRPVDGICDLAESCDGFTADCPEDAFKDGNVCRTAAGTCDLVESCDGLAADCPADDFLDSSTECRPSAGDCDVVDYCTGSDAACPVDTFEPNTTLCRGSVGDCDADEYCSGNTAACPTDLFLPATTVCRTAEDLCDAPETCTGSSADCPTDVLRNTNHVCRPPAGDCDVAETCDGQTSACPDDALQSSSFICRDVAGDCDSPETCSGTSINCGADQFLSSATVCRTSTGECDLTESCSGSGPACPKDLGKQNGTLCASGVCIFGACVAVPDGGIPDGGNLDSGPDGLMDAAPADGPESDGAKTDGPRADAKTGDGPRADSKAQQDSAKSDLPPASEGGIATDGRSDGKTAGDGEVTTPGGCSCRVGDDRPGVSLIILLALGLPLLRRRRRDR